MRPTVLPPLTLQARTAAALALLLTALPVVAEKADRTKPMTLESDKPCTVDLVKQVSVCSGNVVLSQGTLLLRADRLELRETPNGYRQALAQAAAGGTAQYRQRRDGADEVVEGQAQRIEYDSRAGTLRFSGQAQVRRLRAGVAADEIHGALIVWDSLSEQFSVEGGAVTPANPGGRVRAVLNPRPDVAASAPMAPALRSSPSLSDRK
ncbi:MAG: lipopolysaccharide transport periplasmic protein LptA [Aquabacterium sp.]